MDERPYRNPDFVREYEAKLASERRGEIERKARARARARMRRKRVPWYEFTFGTKEHPWHPLNLLPALIIFLLFVLLSWFWD